MVAPNKSAIGFGHHPFGTNPFGIGNWSAEMTFKRFPAWVREADARVGGQVKEPLRRFNDALDPIFNELKQGVVDFTSLSDADRVLEKNINGLGFNLGIPASGSEKEEAFRRSEILNQHLLVLRKGFIKGYGIIAGFQGLIVDVTHLWAIDCCDPNSEFVTEPPSSFMGKFDEIPLDVIPLDKLYNDRLALWPYRLHPIGVVGTLFFDVTLLDSLPLDYSGRFLDLQCPTHFLDLFFSKLDDTEIENYTSVSRATVRELERMRPIHVEFRSITFDGPKAAAYWELSIESDSLAIAYWELSVNGLEPAIAYWEVDVNTSLVV